MTKKQIDSIKGIAILCMIFYHLYNAEVVYTNYQLTGMLISTRMTMEIAKAAHVCVSLFCFCTAYGFTCIMHERTITENYQYAWKKYKQVVMLFATALASLLLMGALVGRTLDVSALWGEHVIQQIIGALLNALGLAGEFGYSYFLGPWWYCTLYVIWIFITPILVEICKKIGVYGTITIGVLLPSILQGNTEYDTVARYFPIYMIGIAWALHDSFVDENKNIKKYTPRKFLLYFLAFCVLVILKHYTKSIYLVEAGMAVCVVMLTQCIVHLVPLCANVLELLGKNCAFMWLGHAYIYGSLSNYAIYKLKNIWLIFLAVSLLAFLYAMGMNLILREMQNGGRKQIWGIYIASMALLLITVPHRYLTNDDLAIQNTLSLAKEYTAARIHQFISIYISYPLSYLYEICPSIQWWYWYSILLMLVGFGMLTLAFARIILHSRSGKNKTLAMGLLTLAIWGFGSYAIARVSFTIVPAILGGGCVALVMTGDGFDERKKKYINNIIVFMGVLLCTFHRRETGYIVLCFVLLAYGYIWLERNINVKDKIIGFTKVSLLYICVVMALGTISTSVKANINGEDFVEYNSARSRYMDYPHDSYDENPILYESVGWNKNTYNMVNAWCFVNPNVSTEAFNTIVEESSNQIDSTWVTNQLSKLLQTRSMQIACFMVIICTGLCIYSVRQRGTYIEKLISALNLVGGMLLVAYQLYTGRILYRSVVIILFLVFVVNAILLLKTVDLSRCQDDVLHMVISLVIMISMVLVIPQVYNPQYEETMNQVDEQYSQINQYIADHPNDIYFFQTGLVQSVSADDMGCGQAYNRLPLGGSEMYSKLFFQKLKRNGLEKLDADIFKQEKGHLVGNLNLEETTEDNTNLVITMYHWLHDEYDAKGIAIVGSIYNGIYIYDYVFEDTEHNYDCYYTFEDYSMVRKVVE